MLNLHERSDIRLSEDKEGSNPRPDPRWHRAWRMAVRRSRNSRPLTVLPRQLPLPVLCLSSRRGSAVAFSSPNHKCHLDRSEAQWRDPCISPLPLPLPVLCLSSCRDLLLSSQLFLLAAVRKSCQTPNTPKLHIKNNITIANKFPQPDRIITDSKRESPGQAGAFFLSHKPFSTNILQVNPLDIIFYSHHTSATITKQVGSYKIPHRGRG